MKRNMVAEAEEMLMKELLPIMIMGCTYHRTEQGMIPLLIELLGTWKLF